MIIFLRSVANGIAASMTIHGDMLLG